MITVSILTIGSELLDGRVHDTNAQFICAELAALGVGTAHILSCTDERADIVRCLKFLAEASRLIVITGGLGPTDDDLTRDAVADFAGKPLERDDAALRQIHEMFTRRGRKFDPSNERQAFFPQGASVIANANGTAPGFKIEKPVEIYCLPGVPSEFKPMFKDFVLPQVRKHAGSEATIRTEAIKLFGLPEAVIGSRVSALKTPPAVDVSYRVVFPEIHVLFKSRNPSADLKALAQSAAESIGSEFVFSTGLEAGFDDTLNRLLTEKKVTIATAESCTGGLAAELLTAAAGSSRYFLGSVVAYSNEIKSSVLEVDEDVLKKHGAVSYEAALLMAKKCREKFASDIAVSITGIAGPDGGTAEKPIGLFFVGLSAGDYAASFRYFLPSSRANIRRYAAFTALDAVRRRLLGVRNLPEYDPAKAK